MPNQRLRIARYLNHLCAGSPQKNMEALGPLGAIVGTIYIALSAGLAGTRRRGNLNTSLSSGAGWAPGASKI